MIKNLFKTFGNLDMSKKLTVVLLVFYLIFIIVGIVALWGFNKNLNSILDYVQSSFMVVLISYFGKSMAENVTRFANNVINNNQNNGGV